MMAHDLMRWAALAAAVAGILRIITSFPLALSGEMLQVLYLGIDVFLFLGVIAIYISQRREARWWATSGFWLALVGAGLLIGHDIVKTLAILYAVAALLFSLGVSVLAINSWIRKALPASVSTLLIVSTLFGILGSIFKELSILFVLSGIIFGIGFASAGLTIWLREARTPGMENSR